MRIIFMKDNHQKLSDQDQDQKPAEHKDMQQRQTGKDLNDFSPVGTTGANYDPTNTSPANERYLRGSQGYGVPDGRTPGYTHKSDQDFIEQRKVEQAQTENAQTATEHLNTAESIGRTQEHRYTQAPDPELRGAVGPTGTGHDEV
jgi:hypothetical protein